MLVYCIVYVIARLFWTIFHETLDPLFAKVLKLLVKLGYVFIVLMAIYIVVRHLLESH
jgi:hypothetical protein